MKTIIKFFAKCIYLFLVWLDQKMGNYQYYKGETAPYCGHGYDGHTGIFTHSHYHESDGGGSSKGWITRNIIGVWYSNVDGDDYGFSFPLRVWLRWFYYEVKRWFKHLVIKIDYPLGKKTLYIHTVVFRNRHYYTKTTSVLHIIRLKYNFFPCSHNTITL